MLGLYKDPKLSLKPVVVLTRLQLEEDASHPAEKNDWQELTDGFKGKASVGHGKNSTHTGNTLPGLQLYNPCSPLVNLIRKRESAVSKMNENVFVVNSQQHSTKSSKKASKQGRPIQRPIKRCTRSNSPERLHKCSQCKESFHTSTLLAAHKRIHDQETDDEDTDTDVDVGVEDSDHTSDHTLMNLTPSHGILNPLNRNWDGKSAGVVTNVIADTSTNSSITTLKCTSKRGSRPARSQLNKCIECPATFSQEWYLQLHMILLHFINKKSINCPGCSVWCEKEQNLRKHIQSHHPLDLQFMNNEISHSLGLSVDSLTGEHLKPGTIRKKLQPVSFLDSRKSNIRVNSTSAKYTQPMSSYISESANPIGSVTECAEDNQPVTTPALNFDQQGQLVMSAKSKLVEKVPVICVTSNLAGQVQPVFLSVSSMPKKPVGVHSPKLAAHPPATVKVPMSISCNWRKSSPSQKDFIIDLVEAELKYIVSERTALGDHFSYSDIQRLSLQVCNSLNILKFFDGSPPKRWAKRVLAKVRQIPRPGRFRFVHNFNRSYVNVINDLSAVGLTEMNIFYVFEARLWDVNNDTISLNPSLKTHQGAIIPDGSLEKSVGVLLSFNAKGSKFLQPYLVYQGHAVQAGNVHSFRTRNCESVSKELIECDYFCAWLSQFLLTIKVRPMLLLVEGDVSHLSYSLLQLVRENNVFILLLPSKKRFVHSHRLIMESVLFPFVEAFDKEVKKCRAVHENDDVIPLNEFGSLYDKALMTALQKVQIRKAFIQAGFLPLPPSVQVLEDATREYLRGIDIPGVRDEITPVSQSPTAADPLLPSASTPLSLPLQSEIKEEPVEFQLENVKEEPVEEDNMSLEVKQEPIECPIDDFIKNDVRASDFETIKIKYEDESVLCSTCGEIISSIQSADDHECKEVRSSIESADEHECKEDWDMGDDRLTPPAPFICGDCGCGFNEKLQLRNHSCHFVDDEEVFTCLVCDSQFFEEATLLKHKCQPFSSVSDECELFKCHECGMSFALKDTLDFHLSMHKESLHRQATFTNPSLSQARHFDFPQNHQQISSKSAQDSNRPSCLPSSSSSGQQVHSSHHQKTKQARMESPSSFTSSRTTSPASSVSSRTLTASPSALSSSSLDQTWHQGQDAEAKVIEAGVLNQHSGGNTGKPGQGLVQLPPPPIPEHDYLGQMYSGTTSLKSVQKANIVNSNSSCAVRVESQNFFINHRIVKLNVSSIATKLPEVAKVSMHNQLMSRLTRGQTRKGQKRQRRLIASIHNK